MKPSNLGERELLIPFASKTIADFQLSFITPSQLSESEDEQPKAKKSKKVKELAIPAHATKQLQFSDDEDAASDDVSVPSLCLQHWV